MAFTDLIDDVVRESWVNPPVQGGVKGKEGVELKWVEYYDKMFTLKILNMPLAELAEASFRINQTPVEPVRSGEGDESPA